MDTGFQLHLAFSQSAFINFHFAIIVHCDREPLSRFQGCFLAVRVNFESILSLGVMNLEFYYFIVRLADRYLTYFDIQKEHHLTYTNYSAKNLSSFKMR